MLWKETTYEIKTPHKQQEVIVTLDGNTPTHPSQVQLKKVKQVIQNHRSIP